MKCANQEGILRLLSAQHEGVNNLIVWNRKIENSRRNIRIAVEYAVHMFFQLSRSGCGFFSCAKGFPHFLCVQSRFPLSFEQNAEREHENLDSISPESF